MLFAGVWHFFTLTSHPRVERSIWKEACVLTESWFSLPFFGRDGNQRRLQRKHKQQDVQQEWSSPKVLSFCCQKILTSIFFLYQCQTTFAGVQYLSIYWRFSAVPLDFPLCFILSKCFILLKCTYFPWGNWDEREALRHCTWWWAGGSRPCPSCTALCRLCSETWPCRSPTGRTPWWPTLATGAHGPETTTRGL